MYERGDADGVGDVDGDSITEDRPRTPPQGTPKRFDFALHPAVEYAERDETFLNLRDEYCAVSLVRSIYDKLKKCGINLVPRCAYSATRVELERFWRQGQTPEDYTE